MTSSPLAQPANLPNLTAQILTQPLSTSQTPSVPVEHEANTYHPNLATHAERNANSYVQPSRKLSKLSDSQKASQQLRRKVDQEEHKRLIEDFDTLLQRHSQEEELAEKYNVKPEYLEKLKGTSKHYKAKREVNIENAKIHTKSIEVNTGMILNLLLVYWTALIIIPRS
jgi:ribonuclease D